MSHVDDPATSAGQSDDDAFAARAAALLGRVDDPDTETGADRGASPEADGGGAGGNGDGDGGDGDDELAEITWQDPIAEAEAARRADDEAYDAALAARRRPVRDTRGRKRREWRQTERARRYAARRSVRFPIFTRSILLWMMIFAIAGLTFGASGAFWWAQFNSQITQLKEDTRDFEQRSQNAQEQIAAERNAALTQIKEANKPLAGFLSEALVVQLAQTFKTRVWAVQTLDDEGQVTIGTAFAVMSDQNETLMVTSYNTIKANALDPGPPDGIELVKDEDRIRATLWATDPAHDLALLSVPRGNIEVMEWAPDDVSARLLGNRVFVVSGMGGNGATLWPGLVTDMSSVGIRQDGTVPVDAEGGPIINANGQVVGVASRTYKPLGKFDPIEGRFSPEVKKVCERVLSCGGAARKERAKKPAPDIVAPPTSSTTSTTAKPPQD